MGIMIPRELCHYTRKDTALEKILFTKKIKLGQLMFTNDPKESAGMLGAFLGSNSNDPESFAVAQELRERSLRIRQEEWKVLCLSRNRTEKGVRSGLLDTLSKGYCKPRMWAHYAENHAGICLIFHGKRLAENIKNAFEQKKEISLYHGPVVYKNFGTIIPFPYIDPKKPHKFDDDEIRSFYHQKHKEVFMIKNSDWRGETEYRWLIHSTSRNEEYVSIEGALKSVLVGMNFPGVYLPTLVKLCEQLKVPAGKVFWHEGIPIVQMDCLYKP